MRQPSRESAASHPYLTRLHPPIVSESAVSIRSGVLARRMYTRSSFRGPVPQRFSGSTFLLENELVQTSAVGFGFFAVTIHQVAKAKNSATILRLRCTNLLLPDALLDLDRPGVEVHVLPLEA